MQLILNSEPALDVQRDMSAIEEIHIEKVGNGDIEKLIEKNCNGNKENIGEDNVISSDEKNKHVLNAEIDLPIDIKLENTEDESSIGVAITEETCKVNILDTNGTQKEEFEKCATDEEIQCTSPIDNESEEKPAETVQEAIVEVKEEIISLEQETVDQIPDITQIKSENTKAENNETITEEDLPGTQDDVEFIEEKTETHTIGETTPVVELKEPVPDVQLEEPASTTENDDKPLFPFNVENKDKPESSDHIEKQLNEIKEPVCDSTDVITSNSARDTSPIELKDDMDVEEIVETAKSKEKDINEIKEPVCDSTDVTTSNSARDTSPIELKDDMDVEEIVETAKSKEKDIDSQTKEKTSAPVSSTIDKPILCKLSNTLDILSDDEDGSDEPLKEEPPKPIDLNEKQCINIEDDDDIMLIDEDTSKTETSQPVNISSKEDTPITAEDKTDSEIGEKTHEIIDFGEKDSTHPEKVKDTNSQININDKEGDKPFEPVSSDLPLLPDNFLKSAKKSISDMTREDLEEFCILRIVESIVDRSNLSEISNKLKTVAQGMEEYRKKTTSLTKQNRDLQVVLKSVQEELKKSLPGTPITPLKITRSVGMQVYMEKTGPRRKNLAQLQNSINTRQSTKSFPNTNLRPKQPAATTQPIPVPRLVPASPAMKSPSTIPMVNQIVPAKVVSPMPNGIKNPSPSQKVGEKRVRNRNLSVTVDLTDDEPPAKVNNRTSPAPPVRLVPSQSLMANPRQAFPAAVSSPRKVYIPISGQQNQTIRPGQTIMLKTVPTPGLRPRIPNTQVGRPATTVRVSKHPAPLPDAMKQYQPPNWKALPPAPDLKLSKVENGIVISWKIEGYQEDSYEEIASYQLYAYQETSSPPSTALWKKIGDVKALPLPMACTLTQFMAGFKYYFAVRAVDIRSRLGPFSLPGSILLLNKL